jgi:lipid II isoglutaminyl synthase (glutamine-hydrolysing)
VTLRSRAALAAASSLSGLSRVTRLGSGSVIGGQLAVLVHRGLLTELSAGRQVALISGTNGKTTTNHFLAAALSTLGPVATNADGANMDAGMVVALGAAPQATRAALECDELWLPQVLRQTGPAVVVLLNLSRDQLDRTQEVRSTADLWRTMLADTPATAVVANADDPLVAWAAWGAPTEVPITWVGTGTWWTLDATGCPACGGRITFDADGWSCASCGFARPEPAVWLDGDTLCSAGGDQVTLPLALPGRANRANAAMATAAAAHFGVGTESAIGAMAPVTDVAGRYRTETVGGKPVRLLLAKNPAGWQEALEMVRGSTAPAVVSINARIADGRDPSWLWDVPFEELRGRFVVAAGERRHDLAVRLAYAEVDHAVAGSLAEAVAVVTAHPSSAAVATTATTTSEAANGVIDVIGNYTALQDHLAEVDRVRHRSRRA